MLGQSHTYQNSNATNKIFGKNNITRNLYKSKFRNIEREILIRVQQNVQQNGL